MIKKGFTTGSIETRIRQLKTSGVPVPFELGAALAVNNAEQCEAEVHALLAGKRSNQDREFFRVPLHDALDKAFPCVSKYLITTAQTDIKSEQDEDLGLDEDDVYFLQCILHDGQAYGEPVSTEQLKEYHLEYHILELENKLIALANKGLIERVATEKEPAVGGK